MRLPGGVIDALWHGIRREIDFAREIKNKGLFRSQLERIEEAMTFFREHADYLSETLEKEYADLLKLAEEKAADPDPQPAA